MKPPKVELEPKEEGYDADGEQEAKGRRPRTSSRTTASTWSRSTTGRRTSSGTATISNTRLGEMLGKSISRYRCLYAFYTTEFCGSYNGMMLPLSPSSLLSSVNQTLWIA